MFKIWEYKTQFHIKPELGIAVLLKTYSDPLTKAIVELHGADEGHVGKIEAIVKNTKSKDELKSEMRPLMIASMLFDSDKYVDLIKFFIKFGHDINETTSSTRTALFYACHMRNKKIIECLLRSGADPNIYGLRSPLKLLTMRSTCDPESVMLLINRGAKITYVPRYGNRPFKSPLYDLCRLGNTKLMEFVIDKYPNCIKDEYVFFETNSEDMVRLLLKHFFITNNSFLSSKNVERLVFRMIINLVDLYLVMDKYIPDHSFYPIHWYKDFNTNKLILDMMIKQNKDFNILNELGYRGAASFDHLILSGQNIETILSRSNYDPSINFRDTLDFILDALVDTDKIFEAIVKYINVDLLYSGGRSILMVIFDDVIVNNLLISRLLTKFPHLENTRDDEGQTIWSDKYLGSSCYDFKINCLIISDEIKDDNDSSSVEHPDYSDSDYDNTDTDTDTDDFEYGSVYHV